MEIKVGIAKTNKYAVSDCGDSVETVERPRGGISIMLADGQGSGKAAKMTSSLVVNKAAQLIAEGARDGAVARAVHDYLYAMKDGKVSSTLTILSADYDAQILLFCRNSNCPVIVRGQFGIDVYEQEVAPIGVHKQMKPLLEQTILEPGTILVSYSDGVQAAGRKRGKVMDREHIIKIIEKHSPGDATFIAEFILEYALELDDYRPGDDMTVIVMGVTETETDHKIEKISVSFPGPS
ncbi:PP2C family protein-serine/threonine phosphatase [Acetonema longum]|uniref:Protein serine/threonine phosphatase n=1 Tax=Acetonema longum DSM 6540 TaxID=1009370 RepID=F7NND3_9FIRM|nr:PP2C family protein-serine/threonine phosphatase [Acetonema longum]EGO62445.1 protein serine/threonine phosphatase [Acetonema longum DSM 6540]